MGKKSLYDLNKDKVFQKQRYFPFFLERNVRLLYIPLLEMALSIFHTFTRRHDLPELGTIRWPPRELKVPKAVHDGSVCRARLWFLIFIASFSSKDCVICGESLDEKSERSSCGVTAPELLYTLIFKLGSGSRMGELVMGILSDTSCRA